jgi:uncharacterized HAD superfamily protein
MNLFGKIALDIDNVIADTDQIIRKLIKSELGINATARQITYWSYSKAIPISPDQEKHIFDLFHQRYCGEVSVLPNAVSSIERLASYFSIWLITSRPVESDQITQEWLKKKRINYTKLIFSKHKALMSENFLFVAEDSGETAVSFAQIGVPVYLFDKPWNGIYHDPLIIRVKNWEDAMKKIENNGFFEFKA